MDHIVTIAGLAVGALMVCTVCAVYFRMQVFGLGGSVLSLLGAVLIGMSVWSNVSLSVGADGTITAQLSQIQDKVAQVSSENQQIGRSVADVRNDIESTNESIGELREQLAAFQSSVGLAPDGIFGPASDARLKETLRRMGASAQDADVVRMVQRITGMEPAAARQYIEEATR